MESSEEDGGPTKKSCCTWPRIVFTFFVMIVAGVLIYLFAPFDKAVANVVPSFGGNSTTVVTPSPTMRPTTSSPSTEPFKFIQCTTQDDCCQGLDGLCDLRVDEIILAGSHNSFASIDKGFVFLPNQEIETRFSLEAGFRDISVDMCNCDFNYVLCHGFCQVGQRSPVEVFTEIVTFLNDNPTEIIVISMEINGSADEPVTLDGIYELLTNVTGMIDMLYQHNSSSEWPTLRTLRDAGTRIILFHYNGEQCDTDNCPKGMNYFWDYAVDTQFELKSVEDLENTTYSCSIKRGTLETSTFFTINGFLSNPSKSVAETINAKNFVNSHIDTCSADNGNLTVTTYYVDFWNAGDLPQVVQERNAALVALRRN